MQKIKVDQEGDFGPLRIENLGYNCTILEAIRQLLRNDSDLMQSSLVSSSGRLRFSDFNVNVATTLDQSYELFVGRVLWGRISFFV
jgi:hypothetical protein